MATPEWNAPTAVTGRLPAGARGFSPAEVRVQPATSPRSSLSNLAVAAAPCSFGVFEEGDGLPDPVALLTAVREAGYDGIDLGPAGYLGKRGVLSRRLRDAGLGLAGGWVQLTEEDRDLAGLSAVLDAFDAGVVPGRPPPRPTLAAGGPPDAVTGSAPELDDGAWSRLAALVARAAAACRARGYEPVFHPHVGTWVETAEQTDRLLEETDVDLCLDTGHLVLGGGDPLAALRQWRERVTHIHLKDVHRESARALAARGAPLREVWAGDVFCELGSGDLELDAFLGELHDFGGWLVVEQDRLVEGDDDLVAASHAQRRNRGWLAERGW